MTKARFQPDRAGVQKFLKSPEMEALMGDHARRVAGRAGAGYRPSTWQGDSRVIGSYRRKEGTTRSATQAQVDNWMRMRGGS